jgi:hypothetical protein
VRGQQAAHPLAEADRHLGGAIVPLGRGQRRESDQVGEEEGVRDGDHGRIPDSI